MRILVFSHDDTLFREGVSVERQRAYCRLLRQERRIVVLAPGAGSQCFEGPALGACSAFAPGPARRIARAVSVGCEIGRRFRPDLVEYQDPRETGVAAWYVARRLGVPLVGAVLHELIDHPDWLSGPRRTLRRLANASAKAVLGRTRLIRCDSEAVRERLAGSGYSQVRMVPFHIPGLSFLRPGADVHEERARSWNHDPVVVCVGRVSPEKGLEDLIDAFSNVPRGRLVLVGDGPDRARLEQRATKLGLADRITWTGALAAPEVKQWLHKAHVLAMPSPAESRARVLVEARVAGVPIVATDAGGTREVVTDGVHGIVIPPGDRAALAAAVNRLLEDRDAWRRMEGCDAAGLIDEHGEAGIRGALASFYSEASSSEARR